MTQLEMDVGAPVAPPTERLHLRDGAKRPSAYDEAARIEAAVPFAKKRRHDFDVGSDEDAAALATDIARRYRGRGDGFELMGELTRDGYPGSSEGVEALDEYIASVADVAARQEREWVAHFGIEPVIAIGEEAEFQWGHERRRGVVSRIECESGKYLIAAEGLRGLAVITYERAAAVGSGTTPDPTTAVTRSGDRK